MKKYFTTLTAIFLLVTFSQLAQADKTSKAKNALDLEAPTIEHKTISEGIPANTPITLSATIKDNIGVKNAQVNYRMAGESEYQQIKMNKIGADLFSIVIPVNTSKQTALEYYIEATDLSGNTILKGLNFSPLRVAITIPVTTPSNQFENDRAFVMENVSTPIETKKKSKDNSWIWWTVGALVAGGATYALTRDDDSGSEPSTGSIVISAPQPN